MRPGMMARRLLHSPVAERLMPWAYAARMSWLAPRAYRRKPELSLVQRLVQPGWVALDIGANGADWTWALAQRVGSEGHVFAFEADPFYATVTGRAIALLRLRNVTLFRFGLSDQQEMADLLIRNEANERYVGTSRIVRERGTADADGQATRVRLERLDDVAVRNPMVSSCRFIKCDVEGFELMVFRGSLALLRRARPIVVTEIGNGQMQGIHEKDIFRLFADLGYVFYGIGVDGATLCPMHCSWHVPFGCIQDVILVPQELEAPLCQEGSTARRPTSRA